MSDIGKEFLELTKYKYLGDSDQEKGLPQPSLELEYEIDSNLINLPEFNKEEYKNISLIDAIINRKSIRKYSDEHITLKELSMLLWTTQGIKLVINNRTTVRTVPSAGARHSFETYLLINNVENLEQGLYRYVASKHSLLKINMEEGIADKITAACYGQGFVKMSGATFIWVAVEYRMTWRYVERGYRYLHLDAGHVCQNLYLAAEAIDCGVCAIGAYNDDELNSLLKIDGKNQFTIYIAAVGKR